MPVNAFNALSHRWGFNMGEGSSSYSSSYKESFVPPKRKFQFWGNGTGSRLLFEELFEEIPLGNGLQSLQAPGGLNPDGLYVPHCQAVPLEVLRELTGNLPGF